MPKYEVGRKVFVIAVLAIAAAVILALAFLGETGLAEKIIDGIFNMHATPGLEGVAS